MTENGDLLKMRYCRTCKMEFKEEYLNNYEVENYSQAKELIDACN